MLAFFLAAYTALEANRYLVSLLFQEAEALAAYFQGKKENAALLGVRVTQQPESYLPLIGETSKTFVLKGGEIRVLVAVPLGEGALEVERRARLFVPSGWPSFFLTVVVGVWAWLRLHGLIRRTLGFQLGAARERLSVLGGALDNLDEGVLVLREDLVELLNPRALELLALPKGAIPPLSLDRVWPALREVLRQGVEEAILALPSHRRARVRILGGGTRQVVVIQDQAELLRLAESLTQSRRTLDLLRAQAHEFRNTLHVLGGLLELGKVEEALRLIQGELGAEEHLEALLSHVELPLVAALLLGKVRRARELGVELEVEGILPFRFAPLAEVLVAAVGHLLENALEAVSNQPRGKVVVRFWEDKGLWLEVRDNGPGVPSGLSKVLFSPGVSGKGRDRGYGLALTRSQVEAYGGRLGYYREGEWTVFYAHFPEVLWAGA